MAVALTDMFKFANLMLRFQEVIRRVRIPRRPDAEENDVEHSYQLAMMAWYLNQADNLGLDVNRVIQYALVHDLAETYAGDVHILDYAGRAGKSEREAKALARIAAEFPEFPEMVDMVHRYETRGDEESKFVYALDKLMPMLMVYLEGGSTWRELDYGLEELLANKDEKTAMSPIIHQLSQEIHAILRANPKLFPRS